ncbi:MAG: hypothetical protein A3C30_00850 [Candidatus Levybacteria bacterium RIFCSPHIGHO2_02_FULL_40_18]|nr:MAG: hypothetical protein A2869_03085 [Candidatus Levybacteria bacterium RIFCSPHIGHO2_01_FULL_40_58]OGH27247.1 MAG: hypothetical protein A3C30_00850 [Candidatus Levybacteria bacterium RIFCSPHIGHO2_02_FULL_40_18]OGH31106.1 MAG: hypothetical protein A3E43_05260 [Candidatus Levybacteria bacterium RIFCSPHIGHO2_12_FULL_40_31]OGH40726.1 MAG: hypothetical protein A2894_03180 [Candidatus Levybacteria bacterium RIFCSPLOWO2_01_FULL_40_64]OGH49365.1 MAG: hypothetical protein A3I54_01820 [Candidatus Lev
MTNKLFIGSLPYSVSDAELQEHFSQVGTVLSAKIITDRYSGQSKGFGFVEMSTPQEAQEAINKLNNSTLSGRTIIVNEAKPEVRREDRGFGNRDHRTQRGNNRKFQSNRRSW